MSEVISLSDVMRELKEIRTEIQELKESKDFELREDFIEDLREIEKEEGIQFESKEELGNYLENL